MSFWDELNDILGYPQKPANKVDPLWDELRNVTAKSQPTNIFDGVSAIDERPLRNNTDSPYRRDPTEIDEIVRNRGVTGFRDVIINPPTVDTSFQCVLSPTKLAELIQYDPATANSSSFVNPTSTWRTIQVPLTGNFLKVDYMFPRRNYYDASWSLGVGAVGDNNTNQYLDDQTYQSTQGNFDDEGKPDGRDAITPIIIQFDSEQSTFHLANHGDIFKLTYNVIFVTFKVTTTRFRLTSGYNSEIVPSPDQAIINSQLHLSGGRGFIQQMMQHPVPFSIDRISSRSVASLEADNAGSTSYIIFNQTNVTTSGVPGNLSQGNIGKGGVALGWLTGISGLGFNTQNQSQISFAIFILDQGNNIIKRLWSKQLFVGNALNTQYFSDWFPIPIRFVLHNNFKLKLQIDRDATLNKWGWNIHGYSIGEPRTTTYPALATDPNVLPYYLPMFTENPYPGDHSGAGHVGAGTGRIEGP